MADPWAAIDKYSIAEDDPYSGVPPAMRGNVKQMVEGRAPVPAGAAMRNPQIMEMMRHANTVDPEFDASKWSARKVFRDGLAKTAPNSPGGQRNAINTMAGHLAEVSDSLAGLHNWDLGVRPLTQGANYLRGMTTEQSAKVTALLNNLAKFGAEETKFYAGAPGTGHERQSAHETYDPNKSPQEHAAALLSSLGLFKDKASILDRQKNEIFGKHGSDLAILSPEAEQAFERVRANADRLIGKRPAKQEAAQAIPAPAGIDPKLWNVMTPQERALWQN